MELLDFSFNEGGGVGIVIQCVTRPTTGSYNMSIQSSLSLEDDCQDLKF